MEAAAAALGHGRRRGADDAYAVALDHWLASGAPDLDERLPPVLAELGPRRRPRRADDLALRRPGRPGRRWPRCCSAASTSCCSTSRPTTSTSTGSSGWSRSCAGLRGGVVLVSHDREFLARCVTRIVELDLAQHQVAVYDGGYDAFLEERAVARRHAREAYERVRRQEGRPRVAGPHPARVELAGRAQRDEEDPRQRQDPAQGGQTESSEKQAQKVRQMESRIARLEEVEEPRKEWVLQFDIAARPALQLGRRDPQRGDRAARRLHPRPGLAAGQRRRPDRHHRTQRRRQDDPAPAAARPRRPRRAARASLGASRRRRRDRPGPHRRSPRTCRSATPSRPPCPT